MASSELILFRGSSRSKSVGLLGITAVLGSQAAPTIASYANELLYRVLAAILERVFRSLEGLAMRYLRLDQQNSVTPSAKDEPESPKSKTAELLEGTTTTILYKRCNQVNLT